MRALHALRARAQRARAARHACVSTRASTCGIRTRVHTRSRDALTPADTAHIGYTCRCLRRQRARARTSRPAVKGQPAAAARQTARRATYASSSRADVGSCSAPPLRAAAPRMRAAWCSARASKLVTAATGNPGGDANTSGSEDNAKDGATESRSVPEKGIMSVTLSALVLLLPTCGENAAHDGSEMRSITRTRRTQASNCTGSGSQTGKRPVHSGAEGTCVKAVNTWQE
jgi:hypothetical protein